MNKHCDDFKPSGLSANNFKCLIFVQGLISAKDIEIRRRVLNKLYHEPNLTLQQIAEDCQICKHTPRFKNIEESGIAHIRKVCQRKKNLILPLNQTNTKRNKTTCLLTHVLVVGRYIGKSSALTGISA